MEVSAEMRDVGGFFLLLLSPIAVDLEAERGLEFMGVFFSTGAWGWLCLCFEPVLNSS